MKGHERVGTHTPSFDFNAVYQGLRLFDEEAELGFLGALLQEDGKEYLPLLAEMDCREFFFPRNERIARAIQALAGRGEPVGLVTAKGELERQGTLAEAGGFDFLAGLPDFAPVCYHAPTHAKSIRRRAVARDLARTLGDTLGKLDPTHDLADVLGAHARSVEVLEQRRAKVSSANGAAAHEAEKRIKTLLEISTSPEVKMEWLWDGVVQWNTVNGIFGQPTTGKSTFAREFALRIARGEPFLGRATKQAPVLIYSLEDNDIAFRAHTDRLARPGQAQTEPVAVAFDAPPPGTFQGLVARLEADIKESGAQVVFIDPMQNYFHFRDADAYAEVAEALALLQGVRARTGTTIFAVHHVGKDFERGPLGTIAWQSVRTSLLIGVEAETTRFLKTKTHIGQPIPKTYLRLMPDATLRLEGTPAELRHEDAVGRLLKVISAEAGLEQDKVIERASLQRAMAVDTLHELESLAILKRSGKGVRGDPIRWWLPSQASP